MERLLSISNSKLVNFRINHILASVLVVCILFFVSEMVFRFLFTPCIFPVEIYRTFNPAQMSYGFDESASVFYQCGAETIFINSGKGPVRYYPMTKSVNDMRVFTLGGSISLRPIDRNYSVYLEQLLRSRINPGESFVVNTAVDGYGTSRMLVMLKQILQTNQKPDLLILHAHGSNEFEDEIQGNYFSEIKNSWYNQMLFNSTFFLVMKRFNQWIVPDLFASGTAELEAEVGKDPDTVERWQQTYNRNLVEICELTNLADVPVIVVLRVVNPDLGIQNTFVDERTKRINEDTIRYTNGCKNAYIFDTPRILEQFFPNPSANKVDHLFVDNYHWNAETHKVVAEQLLEVIKTNAQLANVVH